MGIERRREARRMSGRVAEFICCRKDDGRIIAFDDLLVDSESGRIRALRYGLPVFGDQCSAVEETWDRGIGDRRERSGLSVEDTVL